MNNKNAHGNLYGFFMKQTHMRREIDEESIQSPNSEAGESIRWRITTVNPF